MISLSFFLVEPVSRPTLIGVSFRSPDIVMLGGENLRRGHDGGLVTVVEGDQHTHHGDKGFAASHVSLQQAVHLLAGTAIGTDFFNNPFLRVGQRKG